MEFIPSKSRQIWKGNKNFPMPCGRVQLTCSFSFPLQQGVGALGEAFWSFVFAPNWDEPLVLALATQMLPKDIASLICRAARQWAAREDAAYPDTGIGALLSLEGSQKWALVWVADIWTQAQALSFTNWVTVDKLFHQSGSQFPQVWN